MKTRLGTVLIPVYYIGTCLLILGLPILLGALTENTAILIGGMILCFPLGILMGIGGAELRYRDHWRALYQTHLKQREKPKDQRIIPFRHTL